jgi:hypothetical protein
MIRKKTPEKVSLPRPGIFRETLATGFEFGTYVENIFDVNCSERREIFFKLRAFW